MSAPVVSTGVGGPNDAAAITPHLAVRDARQALAWYQDALGASLRDEPIVMPNGTIGHAELTIGGAALMVSEEHPSIGVVAPVDGEGSSVTLHLDVPDVDIVVERAVRWGAVVKRAVRDDEYGRTAVLHDPFGHRWMVASQRRPGGLRHGDVGYVSLWVPDAQRAADFFGAVLGWRLGSVPGRPEFQVEGQSLHHGLHGGVERPTLFCCFTVEDIESALQRVAAAGGTAGPTELAPFGRVSSCVDDQGVSFAIFEPPEGVAPPHGAPSRNGRQQGDVAYITMEAVDSARARAFYATVLGWHAVPGRVDNGWQIADVAPMVGLSGGHDAAATVPMYRVDDVASAVDSVLAAGGTTGGVEAHPYGLSANCTDDQGTRFSLGQLHD